MGFVGFVIALVPHHVDSALLKRGTLNYALKHVSLPRGLFGRDHNDCPCCADPNCQCLACCKDCPGQ